MICDSPHICPLHPEMMQGFGFRISSSVLGTTTGLLVGAVTSSGSVGVPMGVTTALVGSAVGLQKSTADSASTTRRRNIPIVP